MHENVSEIATKSHNPKRQTKEERSTDGIQIRIGI